LPAEGVARKAFSGKWRKKKQGFAIQKSNREAFALETG
jgi:hypothetical protein